LNIQTRGCDIDILITADIVIMTDIPEDTTKQVSGQENSWFERFEIECYRRLGTRGQEF
jgi:hypothetical protein